MYLIPAFNFNWCQASENLASIYGGLNIVRHLLRPCYDRLEATKHRLPWRWNLVTLRTILLLLYVLQIWEILKLLVFTSTALIRRWAKNFRIVKLSVVTSFDSERHLHGLYSGGHLESNFRRDPPRPAHCGWTANVLNISCTSDEFWVTKHILYCYIVYIKYRYIQIYREEKRFVRVFFLRNREILWPASSCRWNADAQAGRTSRRAPNKASRNRLVRPSDCRKETAAAAAASGKNTCRRNSPLPWRPLLLSSTWRRRSTEPSNRSASLEKHRTDLHVEQLLLSAQFPIPRPLAYS